MNTSSNWKSLGIVTCSGLALCAGALLSGCDKKSEEAARPSSTVTPAKSAPVPEAASPVAEAPQEQAPVTAIDDPNAPLLHLSMNDTGTDATVTDSSPYAQHQTLLDESGTANTKTHSVPGVIETALTFDGVDDAIEIPAEQVSAAFAADQDFTVSFWWKSDNAPFPDGYRAVISNCTTENGGVILYQRGNEAGTDRRIYMNFYVPGNGAPVLSVIPTTANSTTPWHHYLFERKESTLTAYLDGNVVGTYSDPAVTGPMGQNNSFWLNSTNNGTKGSLDDFKLYAKPLSSSEIRQLATTRPGIEDVFLLAEWKRVLKSDPAATPDEIAQTTSKLEAQISASEGYPKLIGDSVELLGFRYTHVRDDIYEMLFAFRAKQKLDRDYHIYVHGLVDPSHVEKIKRFGRDDRLQKWGYAPTPATSTWEPGEIVIVRNQVKAADVPYLMSLNLLYRPEGWAPLADDFVEIGWSASL